MANAFNTTTSLTDIVETAFDRKVEWALRSMPQFRAVVDKRPEAQAMPGDVVVFTIHGDLAVATTPLSEAVDPDSVARPANSRISVTLNEYGNAELDTIRLRKLAFTDVSDEQSITIARNMADSLDALVKAVLDTGTQLYYTNSSGATVTADPGAGNYGAGTAAAFAATVAKLRGKAVEPRSGDLYVAYIHPDISYDLRVQTGNTGWLQPHSYVDTSAIYAGEIGTFVGARFVETPRCTTSGSGVNKLYTSYVMGRQAIAEAVAVEPHVVIGPVVDKLKRFYPLGWYGLLGWSLFRTESLYRIKSNAGIASLT